MRGPLNESHGILPAGVKFLAGVDEVGRGPLAGDVVTAAVILPADHGIEGLADSKVLSVQQSDGKNLYKDIIGRASLLVCGTFQQWLKSIALIYCRRH